MLAEAHLNRFYAQALLLVLTLAGACRAQAPPEVALCDLVKQPSKFSKQVVRVRGRIAVGFEDFTLDSRSCGDRLRGVWLMYGGDEPTPIMSTVNDQERRPGSVLKVDGMSVPLQRDASLELFRNRLVAERVGAPDSLGCYGGDCRLYEVTATLTGLFLAAPTDRVGGYGHLWCCHLLAIQSVSDVSARRTMVPAGGQFFCSTDALKMSAAEAEQLSKRRRCHDQDDCRKAVGEQLGKVASHWGDGIDAGQGSTEFLTGRLTWLSPDLLRTFTLEFHHEDERHQSGALTGAVASRKVCKAVSDPYPLATPIACNQLSSEFTTGETEAMNLSMAGDFGHESWRFGEADVASRHALDEAAKQWRIKLLPDLTLGHCTKPTVYQSEQYAWCDWEEPTSMQGFSVQVRRFQALRRSHDWDSAPWILSRGHGIACTAEHQ